MSLSPAATIVLARAAERTDGRLEFHCKLPTGGRHKMIDALLREGLITETQGDYRLGDGALLIEDSATGLMLTTLALTDAGFRALNLAAPESEPVAETDATDAPTAAHVAAVQAEAVAVADALEAAQGAPVSAPRASLRDAAAAVLAAWDGQTEDARLGLADAIVALRAALAAKPGRPAREPGAPRTPREGTKQQAVLALLRREDGATVAQIAEATGWAGHTVRGFLAGLKKKGIEVTTLERVRMVGPNREGAKGSYTRYAVSA
jgi:hypothetical protein